MVQIPMKTAEPLNRQTVLSINQKRVQAPKTSRNIHSLNAGGQSGAAASGSAGRQHASSSAPSRPASNSSQRPAASAVLASPVTPKPIPALKRPMQKGQKVSLESEGELFQIKACLGWNITNNSCDVDVSAFLLNANGKVPGDSWFVFYGQEKSPDGSAVFSASSGADREIISIDFKKLNPQIHKIVFVLTIHEAFERHLNFSMLKDAYVRIIDQASNRELASFQMDEYYSNVTSMMIGEIYKHNNTWKFNAIGNGVAKDLAGLCGLYGVQVS